MKRQMNGTDIKKTIERNAAAKKWFRGVLSLDQIAFRTNRMTHEVFYIVNNQPSPLKGQHWMAVRLPDRKSGEPSEFFDPLGRPPANYNAVLENVLILNGPKFIYNQEQIQHKDSDFCGYYCMLYLLYRSMNYSMSDIVSMFSPLRRLNNDRLALELVEKHFA